jgi:nucleotide-binding universal stress UspA family protein
VRKERIRSEVMIKVLVPVEADLASSIALRYACQIAKLIETEILTINVRAASSEEYPVGTGWVRHTWEKTMLREAEDDVRQLIRAERANCPTLGEPMVVLGDRDDEILKEIQSGSYGLFLEGTIPTFSSSYFTKRLQSHLYQSMPCPIIMVKNLMPLTRALLVMSDGVDGRRLIQTFTETFKKAVLPIDLFYLKFQEKENGGPEKEKLKGAMDLLQEQGWKAEKSDVLYGRPHELAERLEEYGLLATVLGRSLKKGSPFQEFLVATLSPILLFWQ